MRANYRVIETDINEKYEMRERRDGFLCTTAALLHTYQLKWKVFVVLLFAFLIKALLSSSIL